MLVAGRAKSHIECVHSGAQTRTPYLDRNSDERLEQAKAIFEPMTAGDLVALALATLGRIPDGDFVATIPVDGK